MAAKGGRKKSTLKIRINRAQEAEFFYRLIEVSSAAEKGEVLLGRVLDEISRFSKMPVVALESYDPEAGSMRLEGIVGSELAPGTVTDVENTLSGSVARSRTPLVALSASEHQPGTTEFWRSQRLKTIAGFPVLRGNECIGTLTLGHWEPAELNADVQRWATGMASFLGMLPRRTPGPLPPTESSVRPQPSHDDLTGLPNTDLFRLMLTQALARARRSKDMVAVLLLDLDDFKKFRRDRGENTALNLLKQIAERLRRHVRDGDTLARMGDDRFLWAISNPQKAEDIAVIAEKMLATAKRPVYEGEEEHSVTTSIGISLFPYDGGDAESLIQDADTALIRAKEMGGDLYQFYTEVLHTRITEQLALKRRLREAVTNREFVVQYQPVCDLNSGRIKSVEALARWKNQDGKLLFPEDFLPLSEEAGLIAPLDEWVLTTSCLQAKKWIALNMESLRVSVNISSSLFLQRDFIAKLAAILQETSLHGDSLELELSEHTLRESAEKTASIMQALRDLGVHLSIDDFSSGGFPLNYLEHFRSIKLDPTQIRAAQINNDISGLQAVVSLAHSLSVQVIAKGIETPEQLSFARSLGCDGYQGNLFSSSIPAEDVEDLWNLQPIGKTGISEPDLSVEMERMTVPAAPTSIRPEKPVYKPEIPRLPEPPVSTDIPYDQPISRFKLYSYPYEEKEKPRYPDAKEYFVSCHKCKSRFDALNAAWCSCLTSERTLICPNCLNCFCKASLEYKLDLWTTAPQTMWDRRIAEEKELNELDVNPPPNNLKHPIILVVDDERPILKMASRAIKSLGHSVIVAGNGQEGLETAKLYSPDLILSDALMPKMDGRQMSRMVKQDPQMSKTKVIIMTSLSTRSRDKLAAFREFRVDDYVQKPLEFKELQALLEKHLP